MWPCKNQVRGRLLIATHLDRSNYLANEKQGIVNKYDLTIFIRLFQGSESYEISRVSSGFTGLYWIPPDPLDLTNEPHPRFPVQGHIVLVEMLSHLQEECNKYDLTAGPCFWLANHNDCSKCFAISSLTPICSPIFNFMAEVWNKVNNH
jgi:hypothetical protein